MLRKKIFKLKLNASAFADAYPAGSLRLTLREWAKKVSGEAYFSRGLIPADYAGYNIKNFGCYVFGQPDTWKGVLGVEPDPDNPYIVKVWVDYRASHDDALNIVAMLKPVISALIMEGVIEEADTLI